MTDQAKEEIKRLRESLRQANHGRNATAKALRIAEAAAADGLRAAEELAKAKEAEGKANEAEAIREAMAEYAKAYEATSGKRPKAKEANGDKIGEFAKEVIEARRKLAITQEELAHRANLTQATINRLERGREEATPKTKKKIKEAIERLEQRRNESQTAERKRRR